MNYISPIPLLEWVKSLVFQIMISMAMCKTVVTPLLIQWICCSLAQTHWDRVMHICVNKLTIIGSDNGLLPDQHQVIIWTNAEILLTGPLGINFNEILIEIHTSSFKKMHLKMSSAKWLPFCFRLNVLSRPCVISSVDVSFNLILTGGSLWYGPMRGGVIMWRCL